MAQLQVEKEGSQEAMLRRIREKLTKWWEESTSIRILIIGKSGTGKSSLIKALTGIDAIEGHTLNPETNKVQEFPNTDIQGVSVHVWDTPGLQDGTHNEQEYLDAIKAKCSDVDLVIYCIRMSESRLVKNCDDSKAMQKLYHPSVLGTEKWNNTVIVLTFANLVEKDAKYHKPTSSSDYYREEYRNTEEAVKERLLNDVRLSKEVVNDIPIVPAGYHFTPKLFDLQAGDDSRCYWLSELWLKSLRVTKVDAQPAMIKLNKHRMIESEDEQRSLAETVLVEQVPLVFSLKGKDIGSRLFHSVVGEGTEHGSQIGLDHGRRLSNLFLTEQAEKSKIVTKEEYDFLASYHIVSTHSCTQINS